MILEAPGVKDSIGKELYHLHDIVQQHLTALKEMDYKPYVPFITPVLQLIFDANTMFEWLKHSQESVDVPHYEKLLEFVNLHSQATETFISERKRSSQVEAHSARRNQVTSKPVASFAANAADPAASYVLSKTDKHPLYSCSCFKSLPYCEMICMLKSNKLCMNCFRPGHFVRQSKSLHHYSKCQKPHHTSLQVEAKNSTPTTSDSTIKLKPAVSTAAAG